MSVTASTRNRYVPLDIASVRKRRRQDEDPEKIEQEKWKKFKVVVEGKFPKTPIVHLGLVKRQGTGLDLVVAGSTRIDFNQVVIPYSRGRRDVLATRSFSKFKNYVRCVSVRSDGTLAAAGDDTGLVQIIETRRRTQLRRLKGHKGPVHACSFSIQNGGYVLSGGDDTSLRLWDISDGTCQIEIPSAHLDSVRCIASDPATDRGPETLLFVSGSYDGYVKIWEFNVRAMTHSCAHRFLHGQTVECVAYFPNGTLLLTAGGTEVKIWDLNGGGRLLHSIQSHMKAVTSVAASFDGSYIVTGSLDQSVKFHCASQFNVLHSIYMDDGVTALNTYRTADGMEVLVIGLNDGQWQLLRRLSESTISPDTLEAAKRLKFTALRANTAQYYGRGIDTEPGANSVVVDLMGWRQSSYLDRQIQKFRFHGTLEKVIRMGPALAIAFIEMLIEQGVLRIAVRNRNEQTIQPLLKFVNKVFGRDITSTPILLEFVHAILKENPWLHSSPANDNLLITLRVLSEQLDNEFSQHQILRELSGIIELISLSSGSSS